LEYKQLNENTAIGKYERITPSYPGGMHCTFPLYLTLTRKVLQLTPEPSLKGRH
jgi:hypothetical protein